MSENFPNLPAAIQRYIDADPRNRSKASLSRALSVSRATVTRWTDGEEPEVKRLREIARELGVSVGYLAGDDEFARDEWESNFLRRARVQSEQIRKAIDALLDTPIAPDQQD